MTAARKRAAVVIDEPDLNQAMNGPCREKWTEAINDELASMIQIAMLEMVELTLGFIPQTGKWVLKVERGGPKGRLNVSRQDTL